MVAWYQVMNATATLAYCQVSITLCVHVCCSKTFPCGVIAAPKDEASNRDALSSPVCMYVCMYVYMYIRPGQPATPRLRNSPVFSAGAHDNKTLYLATIGHEAAQHSTSSLHPGLILLLTSPIGSARATRLLAIPPYWLKSFAPRGREHFH